MKRIMDIILSLFGITILSPLLLYIAIRIKLDSKGDVFYRQLRIGKHGNEFYLFKFRSMYDGSDGKHLLTYGNSDSRITGFGKFLRKYKLDELPQLFNVLLGEMSIVGPRPEVKKYVDTYTDEQRQILKVKPGITDLASVTYIDESEMLADRQDPEEYYIRHVVPEKIKLNMVFITAPSLYNYFRIIGLTIKKIATR